MKTIVVIEPYASRVTLLCKSREEGYRTIIVTHNGSQKQQTSEVLRWADQVVQVDTHDTEAVRRELVPLYQTEPVEAVRPGFEYFIPLAAKVASNPGCTGLPVEHIGKARFKDLIRMVLAKVGLCHLVSDSYHNLRSALMQAIKSVHFIA